LPEAQASTPRPDILERIVRTKHDEVSELRHRAAEVYAAAARAPAVRDFQGALDLPGSVAVIAEVKRRSPGAGAIRPGLDPVDVARGYALRGAAAISVLTDRDYFGGSLGDLVAVKAAVGVPVLRKDFVIDPLQVAEARAAGADAVLLIVRILSDALLAELLASARDQGLAALVEVHDGPELERAAAAGARIVGINNRDLATFKTDLDVTVRLLDGLPEGSIVVSESGIRSRPDVERLGAEGVHAVLVGESLLRADDPSEALALIADCPRSVRIRG